jgi:hypothetical protein
MHRIEERPVVRAGKIEAAPMMYLALSYDHRIVDGKEAVTFLVRREGRAGGPGEVGAGPVRPMRLASWISQQSPRIKQQFIWPAAFLLFLNSGLLLWLFGVEGGARIPLSDQDGVRSLMSFLVVLGACGVMIGSGVLWLAKLLLSRAEAG